MAFLAHFFLPNCGIFTAKKLMNGFGPLHITWFLFFRANLPILFFRPPTPFPLPMPGPWLTFGHRPTHMKKLALICLLIGHTALAQAQDKTASLVLALDRQRFDAQVAKDTARLNQLLADDLIYVHSSAVVETKREFVANIANRKWDYRTAKLEGTRVRVYGNTAIVTGQGTLDMMSDGKPIVVRLLYTDVYAKRKGKWQMVSWQSTRLPQ
jgi:ketosteroid isomerase-like protein